MLLCCPEGCLSACLVIVCNLFIGIRAYEQLGYRAFGTPGKMAAGIAITLQNIGGEKPTWLTDVTVCKPPVAENMNYTQLHVLDNPPYPTRHRTIFT